MPPIDHDRAVRVAQAVMREMGHRDPRLPPDEDLLELARAYVELARSAAAAPLAIVVSRAAAIGHACSSSVEPNDYDIESARRELTRLLLGAKPSESNPSQWRRRDARTGLDITARVTVDGPLAIVTHVSVRRLNAGGRRG